MAVLSRHRSAGAGSARQESRFVTFSLGGNAFAISVADVQGIYHGLPLIPTPDLPENIDGEVQVGEARVPVVNLRRFAGLHELARSRASNWLVLVDYRGMPVGLQVDTVTEVVQVYPDQLAHSDGASAVLNSDYISAVAHCDGQALYLPDFNRLLNDAIT